MNSRELPSDRLATSDAEGNRIYLYPADVRGRYRTLRSAVSAVLLVIFLTLPWLRISGEQALLLDIPGRKFAILGLTFWAHDAPILVFVFGGTAILLAAVTAIWGRVWCGWACPQTVFVDAVFRRIERAIEGDSVKRRMLASAPLGWGKFAKRFAKWTLFAVCSLVISHSFLAYFVGTRKLAEMIARPPFENIPSFLFMLGTTLLVLFDFGWFREQFCTLVCPYGRFQSVLMDDRSKAVAYDAKRGEPRRGTTTG
ncbi:MAG: 4Fe-4S dicluster domain-containing protein, partial [Bdellovibrionota bacterium]